MTFLSAVSHVVSLQGEMHRGRVHQRLKAEQTARDSSTLSNTMNSLRKNSEIFLRAINVALRPLVHNRIDITNGSVVTHDLKSFIF